VQLENAFCPILVTLLGILTEAKLAQPKNAPFPILVTLLGILTEVMTELYENDWNAFCPIPTTGSQVFEMLDQKDCGIVTLPVAVEAVIVTPPFSTI
jgi:hypothetical protein